MTPQRIPISELPARLRASAVKRKRTPITYRGVVYRSRTEARYAALLELDVLVGRITCFEHEPFSLDIGAGRKYTPDFRVVPLAGKTILLEVKGFKRVRGKRVYNDGDSRLRFALAREKYVDQYQFRYIRAVDDGCFKEVKVR